MYHVVVILNDNRVLQRGFISHVKVWPFLFSVSVIFLVRDEAG